MTGVMAESRGILEAGALSPAALVVAVRNPGEGAPGVVEAGDHWPSKTREDRYQPGGNLGVGVEGELVIPGEKVMVVAGYQGGLGGLRMLMVACQFHPFRE